MGAKKKRLSALVEAVSEILGTSKKAKKLKKAKALERFIAKLEDKLDTIEKEIAKGKLGKKAHTERSHQAKELAKQIKKAKKILSDMN